MALIEKEYEYLSENSAIYNEDAYISHFGSAIDYELGNIKLRNYLETPKTENFYGDGRHGSYTHVSDYANPSCLYFKELIQHEIYGPCLYDTWFTSGTLTPGDEVVLFKKHIKNYDYLDEYGQWDVVNLVEKIVDASGITLWVIDRFPDIAFTENTANSCTRIWQYKTLTVNPGIDFGVGGFNAYTVVQIPHWGSRVISHPIGFVYIKATEKIELKDGARIVSTYGHHGSRSYSYIGVYQNPIRSTIFYTGGSPMGGAATTLESGGGTSSRYNVSDSLIDPSSTPPVINVYNSPSTTSIYSPGASGQYGQGNLLDTKYANPLPEVSDLNHKLYPGNGGTCYLGYRDHRDAVQAYNSFGYSGGGIIVVQTPKIIFGSTTTQISVAQGGTGVSNANGYAAGGSMLIKAEKIEFPHQTITSRTSTAFHSGGVTNSTTSWFGAIGLSQLEFDQIIDKDGTYGVDELTALITNDTQMVVNARAYAQAYATIGKKNNTQPTIDIEKVLFKHNHAYSAPQYETGSFFKVYTNGLGNVDASQWKTVTRINVSYFKPEGAEIKIMFSFDSGATWKWIDVNNMTLLNGSLNMMESQGNTPEELNAIIDKTYQLTNMMLMQNANRSIDVAIGMKTNKSHISPSVDSVWFYYETPEKLKAPIPILPYNGDEFDNEEVDFVWLQPEQQFGSIHNRLEISNNPNFTQEYIEVLPEMDKYPTSGDKISLPINPRIYDNYRDIVGYFKLPHMKTRGMPYSNIADQWYPSATYNGGDRSITYSGGDVFFIRGKFKKLLQQATPISLGSVNSKAPLLSQMTTKPQENKIASMVKFAGITDPSGVTDIKGRYTSMVPGSSMYVVAHNYQTSCLKWVTGTNGSYFYVQKSIPYAEAKNQVVYNSTRAKTFHFKFRLDETVTGYKQLFALTGTNTEGSTTAGYLLAGLTLYRDANGSLRIATQSHTTIATWFYPEFKKEAEECNVTAVYLGNGQCKLYWDGVFLGTSLGSTYYADLQTYASYSFYNFMVGSNDYNGVGNNFAGFIYEMTVWEDTELSEAEIKEISKVPYFHLRYDVASDTVEWKQIPYSDHMPERQNYINAVWNDTNTEIAGKYSMHFKNNFYKSTDTSILLGYWKPNITDSNSWEPADCRHSPIKGYRFIPNVGNNEAAFLNLQYTDSGTIKDWSGRNLTLNHTYFVAHERVDRTTNDIELSFKYKAYETYSANNAIALRFGGFGSSYTTQGVASYIVYLSTYNNTNQNMRVYASYVRASDNTNVVVKNHVDGGFSLKDGHIYTLKYDTQGTLKGSKAYLISKTDSNFFEPVVLFDMATVVDIPQTYGFVTMDRSNQTIAYGNRYEDISLSFSDPQNCFELISMNISDAASVLSQDLGYSTQYYIEKVLDANFTNKLNYCDVSAQMESSSTDVRFKISFDGGNIWKKYNSDTKIWSNVVEGEESNAMSLNDVMALTTAVFNDGGWSDSQTTKIRMYLMTTDANYTPLVSYWKTFYNGPLIIDSWSSPGSFYDPGYTFKYLDDGSWTVYDDIDTSDTSSQNWKDFGILPPNPNKFENGAGSKPTFGSVKSFGTCRVRLTPKGKWYWRIAAVSDLN